MSDAYVIELNGKTAGIIVRASGADRGYKFLSSLREFDTLEGRHFVGPYEAERAARAFSKPSRQKST